MESGKNLLLKLSVKAYKLSHKLTGYKPATGRKSRAKLLK